MSLPQTPGGVGPSQLFWALEFDDPTPRAVVLAVMRYDVFSGSESNNNADNDMSDSDAPVTAHSYPYQMITSPDELSRGARLLESFRPHTRPASITSGKRSNPRTDWRPACPPPAPKIPREAIDQVVAEIISQGQAEFNKQWQELNELASSLIAQSNELWWQQEAQNVIFLVAKTTSNDLNTLRDQVKAEMGALLATSSTQTEKVHTFTEQISTALTKQWEDLTKVIKSETTTIGDGAKERFDQVNKELIKLYDWTKKSIDQEVQDRIASDKAVGEIAIAAVVKIKSLKRKQKESPALLGTASTKRQWQHQPDITLDLRETSELPPPPQSKKEPRNIPQPDKYDRSSTKLKPFLNDVANVFERMPITYDSATAKILYVAALLTGSAKQ